MITLVRKATVVTGKLGEAVGFAKEIASIASRAIGSEVQDSISAQDRRSEGSAVGIT